MVPPSIAEIGPDAIRRAEFAVATASIVCAVTLARGLILLARGPASQGLVALGVATACVGCLWLLRRTASLLLVGNVLSGAFFVALTILIYRRGGIGSPPTIALCIVPMLGVLIAGFRSGIVWALLAVTELVVFALWNPDLPDMFPVAQRRTLGLLGGVTVIAICLGLSAAYEKTKDAALRAQDEAERRRESLADERSRLAMDLERAANEVSAARNQRLAALGELSAGVAHDFNNLLVAILNFSELAKEELESDPEGARASLDEVRAAADRAALLTRQLLSFAKEQETHRTELDTVPVVEDLVRMLRRLVPESIDLVVELGRDTGRILADRGQVEQVLMNLCLNARDAMPNGGRLVIASTNATLDAERATALGVPSGHYVALRVSDTGVGIDDEVRSRMFEPFFSTKDEALGTGLGLSTVYGIVQKHGGAIVVDSEPGRGAAFTVYLPVAVPRGLASSRPPARSGPSDAVGTVLLAEDDDQVRRLAQTILQSSGFRVLAAKDGEHALRLFEEHADAIDLALVDVVMPIMGGKELFDRVRASRPDLPFLFCSGYADAPFPPGFFDDPRRKLLPKPYVAADLLGEVRGLLTGRERAVRADTA